MVAEKPLTIATYAAGASLAAITLVYVFGPTFILDGDQSKSSSRRAAIGLSNPANDCFINSVLQALAGLPDLRKYLIRETHRRKLDGKDVYEVTANEAEGEGLTQVKLLRLRNTRAGMVTEALKDILDHLNERPIYKKTISAQPFIRALEQALQTRISRQQQDAQEFLQVVAEHVCEEYHAGCKARRHARNLSLANSERINESATAITDGSIAGDPEDGTDVSASSSPPDDFETQTLASMVPATEEEGFPLEGKVESSIECQTCGFVPRPSISSFVTVTLNVPQRSSTTLNQCFDGLLKEEVIEDYKCDRCRLEHAISFKKGQLVPKLEQEQRTVLEAEIEELRKALEEDPEKPPEHVKLPDTRLAPKRTIKKHTRISSFPKVLCIHLSRSIFDAHYSTKNTAKVAFPETLPLGTILDQKQYRLLCVVNHKGGHHSGHYETFRRQVTATPYSTPHTFGTEGAYSRSGSPALSAVATPRISALDLNPKRTPAVSNKSPLSPQAQTDVATVPSELLSPLPLSPSTSSLSSRSSFSISGSLRRKQRPPTSAPRDSPTPGPALEVDNASTLARAPQQPATSVRLGTTSKLRKNSTSLVPKSSRKHRKKAASNKWWRISDEKIKESSTSEVLGQQKEVYLLFYEMISNDEVEE